MDNNQYKVLARKYRPATFDSLIGQEALVRTLANAIKTGRLAQAYMLTGIRGVGKTTSARIIAKALNCVGPDGKGGMTTNPCGVCEHCRAIAEDRDVDVQEIDAASNTQIDNIREIIQAAKYNPVSARYKVYIIDEVHMLSKGASNALLKLLEEPPERLKFIFATTEIRRVPVTILSRCQRFDLRRVEPAEIAKYFKEIVKKEGVDATDEAIDIIAKCADGSVRDGLSLLDQAIALSAGKVDVPMVRSMLGLADNGLLLDLLEKLLEGKAAEVLQIVDDMKASGADALMILQDLSELVYVLTKLKIEPDLKTLVELNSGDAERMRAMAAKLSMAVLTRLWQMLFKGIADVKTASSSFVALEMVLVRVAYAYGVLTPADIVREINAMPDDVAEEKAACVKTVSAPVPVSSASAVGVVESVINEKPAVTVSDAKIHLSSLKDMVDLLRKNGHDLLALDVEKYVHLVEFGEKRVKVRLEGEYPHDILLKLTAILRNIANMEFDFVAVEDKGEDTLKQQKEAKDCEMRQELAKDPLAKAALEAFPDAKVTEAIPLNLFGDFADDENSFNDNDCDEGE